MDTQDDDTRPAVIPCPACGREFPCGFEAGLEECWCFDEPPAGGIPAQYAGRCLCPDCLAEHTDAGD